MTAAGLQAQAQTGHSPDLQCKESSIPTWGPPVMLSKIESDGLYLGLGSSSHTCALRNITPLIPSSGLRHSHAHTSKRLVILACHFVLLIKKGLLFGARDRETL